jgi:ABC-2 type transport system permease protein
VTELVAPIGRLDAVANELAKLPAFLRRDLLVAWSYRVAFFSDLVNLAVQTLTFYFVGRMVDPTKLPAFGGTRVSYMEFAAVGIGVAAFLQLGLGRVALAVRGEQLLGTLESILMTPTATSTVQLGSAVFDLLYVPIRTGLFLLVVGAAFGLHFHPGGVVPAALVLLVFIPFVWGLGVFAAAVTLTFKRGTGAVGLGAVVLGIFSGAYFPLELLPHWLATIASDNPIARAMDGIRTALLSDAGWAGVGSDLALLAPLSALSLALGLGAFRLALLRERKRGTLGQY